MDHLDRLLQRVCTLAVWVAGGILILAAIGVAIEVVLRKVFVVSVGGATELSGYTLAVVSSWAFAFTFLNRAHVRIDSLYRIFPLRIRVLLDVLALSSFIGFMLILTHRAFKVLLVSIEYNTISMTPLATPIWIPQTLWVIGLSLFVIVLTSMLARTGLALVKGDFVGVNRLIGTVGMEEEIEELEDLTEQALGDGARSAETEQRNAP